MFTYMYNPIGKSLLQVHNDCRSSVTGFAVFILSDEEDTVGKLVGEGFSISACLGYKKDYADYIVKMENDFFGQTVLRAIHPDLYKRSDK